MSMIFSDAILGELCALESHFPTSSSTSTASSTTSSTGTVLQRAPNGISLEPGIVSDSELHEELSTQPPPPPPPLMMSSQENIQKYLMSAEPQYITAESVRQNKLLNTSGNFRHNLGIFCKYPSNNSLFWFQVGVPNSKREQTVPTMIRPFVTIRPAIPEVIVVTHKN